MKIKINYLYFLVILIYSLIALYLIIYPYSFAGKLISPNYYTTQGDIGFYIKSQELIFSNTNTIIENYIKWLYEPLKNNFNFSGPIFPFLLQITNYDNQVFLLNSIFLAFGITNMIVVVNWFYRKFFNTIYIVIFIFFPYFILYTFQPGTDIIFTLTAFIFFVFIDKLSETKDFELEKKIYYLLVGLACLSSLIRPNGFLLFILLLFFSPKNWSRMRKIINYCLVSAVILFFIIYYLPYGFAFLKVTFAENQKIFGIGQGYFINEFPSQLIEIPHYLYKSFLLIMVKLLTLTGFYVSQQGNLFHYALRLFFALPLLIGFVEVFRTGKKHEIGFCLLFLLPCLIGHSGERYIAPLMPIIFFYGCNFINKIFK